MTMPRDPYDNDRGEEDNGEDENAWRERFRERRRERRERNSAFTREERDRVLKMLEDHERARWFWATAALVAKWITSVAAGSVVVISALKWGFGEIANWHPWR